MILKYNTQDILFRINNINKLYFQDNILVSALFNQFKEQVLDMIYETSMPPIAHKDKEVEEIKDIWKNNQNFIDKIKSSSGFYEIYNIESKRMKYLNENLPSLNIEPERGVANVNFLLSNIVNKTEKILQENAEEKTIQSRAIILYDNLKNMLIKKNSNNINFDEQYNPYIPDDIILIKAKNVLEKFGFNSYNTEIQSNNNIDISDSILKKVNNTERVLGQASNEYGIFDKDIGMNGYINYHDKPNMFEITVTNHKNSLILGAHRNSHIGINHEGLEKYIDGKFRDKEYDLDFNKEMSRVFMHEYMHNVDEIIGKRVCKEKNIKGHVLFSSFHKNLRVKEYNEINESFRDLLYYSYNNGKKKTVEEAREKIKKKNDHITDKLLCKILPFNQYLKVKDKVVNQSEEFLYFIYNIKKYSSTEDIESHRQHINMCINNKAFNGLIKDIYKASGKDKKFAEKILSVVKENKDILDKHPMRIERDFDIYYDSINIATTEKYRNKNDIYFDYISSIRERIANAICVKKNEEFINKTLRNLIDYSYESLSICQSQENKQTLKSKIKKIKYNLTNNSPVEKRRTISPSLK